MGLLLLLLLLLFLLLLLLWLLLSLLLLLSFEQLIQRLPSRIHPTAEVNEFSYRCSCCRCCCCCHPDTCDSSGCSEIGHATATRRRDFTCFAILCGRRSSWVVVAAE